MHVSKDSLLFGMLYGLITTVVIKCHMHHIKRIVKSLPSSIMHGFNLPVGVGRWAGLHSLAVMLKATAMMRRWESLKGRQPDVYWWMEPCGDNSAHAPCIVYHRWWSIWWPAVCFSSIWKVCHHWIYQLENTKLLMLRCASLRGWNVWRELHALDLRSLADGEMRAHSHLPIQLLYLANSVMHCFLAGIILLQAHGYAFLEK